MKPLYNQIATSYDADPFNLFDYSHSLAFNQIQSHLTSLTSVTDFGVGTGTFALRLSHNLPFKHFYGIDVSDKMLAVAKSKLPFEWTAINADAKEARSYLEENSQDLILSHFLYDYVAPEILVPLAYKLLKPGGFLSVLTSTKEQFDEAFYQKVYSAPLVPKHLKIKEKIEKSTVIPSHDVHIALAQKNGFLLVASERLTRPVQLKKASELIHFAYNSGWLASGFTSYSAAHMASLKAAVRLLQLPFFNVYPLHFNFRGSCLLLQKPKTL